MNYKRENLPPQLRLTPIQNKYLNDWSHRFFVIPPGRRARKTLIGKRKIYTKAMQNPGYRYVMAAPTSSQAKRIFWDDLKKDMSYFIKSKSEVDKQVVLLNDAIIELASLDKPERIEGTPLHGILITETGDVKESAWLEHVRPCLSDTHGFALLDGVPEGRNWYYDKALYACGGALPETLHFHGAFADSVVDGDNWAYYHWFSSDVLSANEIAAAKREYDERTFRQEYEGSFEGYAGLAYWSFGSHNIDESIVQNPFDMISIGMDFNVDPMTAVLCNVGADEIRQFGEVYLKNSNTYEMVDHLKELFPVEKCIIYPDSTGKAEKSNATQSDLAILKKSGFKVRARNSNPRQRDRINAVNSLCYTMDGRVRYKVNPVTCPKTVNDFNKVECMPDGRLNKDQEKEGLVHITDGLGYLVHMLFPVRKTESRGVQQ